MGTVGGPASKIKSTAQATDQARALTHPHQGDKYAKCNRHGSSNEQTQKKPPINTPPRPTQKHTQQPKNQPHKIGRTANQPKRKPSPLSLGKDPRPPKKRQRNLKHRAQKKGGEETGKWRKDANKPKGKALGSATPKWRAPSVQRSWQSTHVTSPSATREQQPRKLGKRNPKKISFER